MRTTTPDEPVDRGCRRFFGAAALAVAAARLGLVGQANAQTSKTLPAIKPGTNTSFGPLKQVDAGVVNIGYAEAGPADGPRSSFCTAGHMTSTATSMSHRRWRRRATG